MNESTPPHAPPAALPPEVRARVEQFLEGVDRAVHSAPDSTSADTSFDASLASGRVTTLVPLTPDASDRRYVRVERHGATPFVLAVHTGPIDFARLPFTNVRGLLAELSLPAPVILGHSDALGIIALEDLGDVTLQAHVTTATASTRARLYDEAVELIEALQRRGQATSSSNYVPYGLAFDVEKLTWELDFFATHFLGAHRGIVLTPAEHEALSVEFGAVTSELASEPRVLCHRDFHSRNLMVHAGALYLIDFQDARMGPDTYDLASLLRDAYLDLEEAEVERLIARFVALKTRHGSSERGASYARDFRRRFDLMSLQRNLKALGTFGFQATSRQNPGYLRDVPRTLWHVRTNLKRYPRFERLHALLSAPIPELR
jgi:aminoglycoside/choline kinase family phosphotransferase